jgi:NAD(P)-dependent dehydrogenase (short-subunit alcohol dehydrogenase family)
MPSLFELTGKVAVVTGATKGIGRAIAHQLAASGAKVVVSSRTQAECDAYATKLNSQFGHEQEIARGLACDLDHLPGIEPFAAACIAAWGGIDVLVCNAAVMPYIGPSNETPPQLFDRLLVTNVHHNFRLCQALRPSMAARGGGSVVLIGSVTGHIPSPLTLAYGLSKAALAHMARSLAQEFVTEKIRVNCIAPGTTHSHSTDTTYADPEAMQRATEAIPLQRIGDPEDIAGAVVFLCSRAGSYLTGAVLPVDGGRATIDVGSRLQPLAQAAGIPAQHAAMHAASEPQGARG